MPKRSARNSPGKLSPSDSPQSQGPERGSESQDVSFQAEYDAAVVTLAQLRDVSCNKDMSTEYSLASSGFASRTTVGLLIAGCTVDNIVAGGPADLAKNLQKGDRILKVDGVPVQDDQISAALIGSDHPGSTVTLEISRSELEATKLVVLERMANEVIADRRALFEIFAKSKDRALAQCDNKLARLVDSSIELWTKMYKADAERHQSRAAHTQGRDVETWDKLEAHLHAMRRAFLLNTRDHQTAGKSSFEAPAYTHAAARGAQLYERGAVVMHGQHLEHYAGEYAQALQDTLTQNSAQNTMVSPGSAEIEFADEQSTGIAMETHEDHHGPGENQGEQRTDLDSLRRDLEERVAQRDSELESLRDCLMEVREIETDLQLDQAEGACNHAWTHDPGPVHAASESDSRAAKEKTLNTAVTTTEGEDWSEELAALRSDLALHVVALAERDSELQSLRECVEEVRELRTDVGLGRDVLGSGKEHGVVDSSGSSGMDSDHEQKQHVVRAQALDLDAIIQAETLDDSAESRELDVLRRDLELSVIALQERDREVQNLRECVQELQIIRTHASESRGLECTGQKRSGESVSGRETQGERHCNEKMAQMETKLVEMQATAAAMEEENLLWRQERGGLLSEAAQLREMVRDAHERREAALLELERLTQVVAQREGTLKMLRKDLEMARSDFLAEKELGAGKVSPEKLRRSEKELAATRQEAALLSEEIERLRNAQQASTSAAEQDLERKAAHMEHVLSDLEQSIGALSSSQLGFAASALQRQLDTSQRAQKLQDPQPQTNKPSSLASETPLRCGVGMKITDVPPHRAVELLPGGQALSSGQIQLGDLLVAVDGEDVSHQAIQYIRSKIVGPPGSGVSLKFARTTGSRQTTFEVALRRGRIDGGGGLGSPLA